MGATIGRAHFRKLGFCRRYGIIPGVTASRIERQLTKRLSGQAILRTSEAGKIQDRKAERVLLHQAWQRPDTALISRALVASGSTSSL
jgi:hypothetical protein